MMFRVEFTISRYDEEEHIPADKMQDVLTAFLMALVKLGEAFGWKVSNPFASRI